MSDMPLITIGLPIALAIIMFGLGLSLTVSDFRRVAPDRQRTILRDTYTRYLERTRVRLRDEEIEAQQAARAASPPPAALFDIDHDLSAEVGRLESAFAAAPHDPQPAMELAVLYARNGEMGLAREALDEAAAEDWEATVSREGPLPALFVEDDERFIEALQQATWVRIEAPLASAPQRPLEFEVAGFERSRWLAEGDAADGADPAAAGSAQPATEAGNGEGTPAEAAAAGDEAAGDDDAG